MKDIVFENTDIKIEAQIHTKLLIQRVIFKYYPETIAEVGVYRGSTSAAIGKYCPCVKNYYLVDPWLEYKGAGSGSMGARNSQENWNKFYQEVCEKFGKDPRYTILRMKSLEGAKQFRDRSLDLVFIDALHTNEACADDINAWKPKIKFGGIISGDDYSMVKGAVRRLLPNHESASNRIWWDLV